MDVIQGDGMNRWREDEYGLQHTFTPYEGPQPIQEPHVGVSINGMDANLYLALDRIERILERIERLLIANDTEQDDGKQQLD